MRSLLIVDDEEIILNTLKTVFESQGYTPYCSLNGEGALELMQQHQLKVIFTDLRMPQMDGMELCRRVKALDPDSTVYALSAYVDAYTPEQMLEAGFDDRFKKPFNLSEILIACEAGFDKLGAKNPLLFAPDDERRQYHRLVLEDRVFASILMCDSDRTLIGKTLDCTQCSVSVGGIAVHTEHILAKGANLQLHVGISGAPKSFSLNGEIKWVEEDSWAQAGQKRCRAGLAILESSSDHSPWDSYLSQPTMRKFIINGRAPESSA